MLAIPVAPAETLAEMRTEADDVVCIATPSRFRSVGEFYTDFHQLSDEETVAYVRTARHGDAARTDGEIVRCDVRLPPIGLAGVLPVPRHALGVMVLFVAAGPAD